MYPGMQAKTRPDQPAIIMAGSGETVTYRELDERSNRLAHLLRAEGLQRGDHYAVFLENHVRFVECSAAGERSGLYYTNVNSYLSAGELAYIVNNSLSKVLITSQARREVALAALRECPDVALCLIVDGPGEGIRVRNLDEATAAFPTTPIADEALGGAMLYSSGTTGRPKGVLRPLPEQPPEEPLPILKLFAKFWGLRDGQIYLSPAPLYHAAPLARRRVDDPLWRDRDHHGAFPPGGLSAPRREASRDSHAARADDVRAHAEAAGGDAASL